MNKIPFQEFMKMTASDMLARADDLSSGQISVGAEMIGNQLDSSVAVPCLLKWLDHDRPVAREGALIGLQKHMHIPEVRARVLRVAEEDVSEVLREDAKDALEEAEQIRITLPPAPCDRVPDGKDIPNVGPVDINAFMNAFCDVS